MCCVYYIQVVVFAPVLCLFLTMVARSIKCTAWCALHFLDCSMLLCPIVPSTCVSCSGMFLLHLETDSNGCYICADEITQPMEQLKELCSLVLCCCVRFSWLLVYHLLQGWRWITHTHGHTHMRAHAHTHTATHTHARTRTHTHTHTHTLIIYFSIRNKQLTRCMANYFIRAYKEKESGSKWMDKTFSIERRYLSEEDEPVWSKSSKKLKGLKGNISFISFLFLFLFLSVLSLFHKWSERRKLFFLEVFALENELKIISRKYTKIMPA